MSLRMELSVPSLYIQSLQTVLVSEPQDYTHVLPCMTEPV